VQEGLWKTAPAEVDRMFARWERALAACHKDDPFAPAAVENTTEPKDAFASSASRPQSRTPLGIMESPGTLYTLPQKRKLSYPLPPAQANTQSAGDESSSPDEPAADAGVDDLVNLDEAAAMVHRSKRTLERQLSKMPAPHVQGGGGKPSLWKWAELRPWLEKEFVPDLPKRFPRNIR